MRVVFYHRKVIPNFHFSVEIIFRDVREHLPKDISCDIITSRYYSKGFFPRLYNCIEAYLKQGPINHVTGDINYIGLLLNKKTTIHTILDCVFMHASSGVKQKILGLFWLKIPVYRSKFVTTISHSSKQEIIKYTGCRPGKIVVIPIPLSPVFSFSERSYNWEKPTILIIGTAPNKNLKRIFLALNGISCKVFMIGKPEETVREMMLENKLEFEYLSGLSSEQMSEKYRQSEMLVFASLYEGFGMPIIEAQATGLPVVTSNISSMPEVAGKEGAVLVDPYDVNSIKQGIQSIILDPGLRERLILNGFENIKRFSPQVISNMYYKLYQSI